MKTIHAPWRINYILGPKPDACVFCLPHSTDEDEVRFVLCRADHCFVIMNIFPYSNGHLIVHPLPPRQQHYGTDSIGMSRGYGLCTKEFFYSRASFQTARYKYRGEYWRGRRCWNQRTPPCPPGPAMEWRPLLYGHYVRNQCSPGTPAIDLRTTTTFF